MSNLERVFPVPDTGTPLPACSRVWNVVQTFDHIWLYPYFRVRVTAYGLMVWEVDMMLCARWVNHSYCQTLLVPRNYLQNITYSSEKAIKGLVTLDHTNHSWLRSTTSACHCNHHATVYAYCTYSMYSYARMCDLTSTMQMLWYSI